MKNRKITFNKLPGSKILVVAVLIVNTRGKILLARRPEGKSMAGLWEFPGGKVHDGESETEALVRELREEVALTVREKDLIRVMEVSHDYADFHLMMPLYLCRKWRGEPAPLEGQQLAWVKPKELSGYAMPPADEPVIAKIPGILEKY